MHGIGQSYEYFNKHTIGIYEITPLTRFIGEAEASILQLLHGAIVFLYAVVVFSDIPKCNIMLNSDYFILPPG